MHQCTEVTGDNYSRYEHAQMYVTVLSARAPETWLSLELRAAFSFP